MLAEHNDERAAVLQGALEERDRALAKLRAQHDAALARLDDSEHQVSALDQQIGAITLRADKLQVRSAEQGLCAQAAVQTVRRRPGLSVEC